MPPFWPFKRTNKKEEVIDETPPAPIVYRKGQDVHTEKHSTTEERNESAYKDALALFGGGDTTVVASSNVADEYDGVSNEPTMSQHLRQNQRLNGFTIQTAIITRNSAMGPLNQQHM